MTPIRATLTLSATTSLVLALPVPAHAHLMNTGFGPFYDGVTHLFVTPEELLPVVALALFAGLRGPTFGRTVLVSLPLAWLTASLVSAVVMPPDVAPSAVSAGAAILFGLLLAIDRPCPLVAVTGLSITLGVLNGGLSGLELARARASWLTAAGSASGLLVLIALVAGHSTSIRAPWARVAIRVAGSWTVAIGLLMLGWSARGAR
jgi:hydrogenase/urease accessory protein HupE